jgi:hypothetical protein
VHLNDGFADGKAEPKTFTPGPALFKRVKDSIEKLWLNSDAAVADLDRE